VIEEKKSYLLSNLPGIYHEEGVTKENPLWALLLIASSIFSRYEETIEGISRYFDPELVPAQLDQKGRDFLTWLSSWVALDLHMSMPRQKKRYLIRNAVMLYCHRGTLAGLQYLLNLYFDINVAIREWSWPQGLVVGLNSTIQEDTFLVEQLDLNHCFEVIWKPPYPNMARDRFEKLASRVRQMIDLEKPAHTKCYFSVESPEIISADLPWMVIGIFSKIGLCVIK
jgi:phage tail-like protein